VTISRYSVTIDIDGWKWTYWHSVGTVRVKYCKALILLIIIIFSPVTYYAI